MYALQQIDKNLPPRHSLIPGTNQKFLYMQDFYTMTWGDLIGLVWIMNAFVHLVVHGHVGYGQWIFFAIIATASAFFFMAMCLGPTHKPDQGFPEVGKISMHGISHLPYFGIYAAVSMLSIYHLFSENIASPIMWLGLAGGLIWVASQIADQKAGNFNPLKKLDSTDQFEDSVPILFGKNHPKF